MKRHIALALIICLLLAVFGCSNTPETQTIDVTEQAQESPFSNIVIDGNGHLIISMKDGSSYDIGSVQGEKGDPGEPGRDGLDGEDGRDGKDGKNGKDGLNGKDGRDGINGSDGRDGSSNGGTAKLSDCAIGTTFPCYPNTSFDYNISDRAFAAGTTVHVSSMTLTLSAKNNTTEALEAYSQSSSQTSFSPYVLTMRATGTADSSLAGNYVNIDLAGDYGIWCYGIIESDGSFDAVFDNGGRTTVPSELWVSGIMIADNPGGE